MYFLMELHEDLSSRQYWRINFHIAHNSYTNADELFIVLQNLYSQTKLMGWKMRNPNKNKYIFNSWNTEIKLFRVTPGITLDKLAIAISIKNV